MELQNFDVTQKADEGVWFTLRHPVTGDDLDGRIKVAGKDSQLFRKLVFQMLDKRARKNTPTTAEQAAEDTLWIVSKCVLDWQNITEGGQPLKLDNNGDVARQVLRKYPWILEQIQEAMAARATEDDAIEGKSLHGQAGASSSATAETAHRTGTKAARSSASAATEA